MQNKQNAEFQNEIAKITKNGTSYDDAFQIVQHRRPDLLRQMKHSPAIGPQRAAIRAKLRADFANDSASTALGNNLFPLFPDDLAASLHLTANDSTAIIKQKIIEGTGGLSSTQITSLVKVILKALNRTTGNPNQAWDWGKSLFPQIFSLPGAQEAKPAS